MILQKRTCLILAVPREKEDDARGKDGHRPGGGHPVLFPTRNSIPMPVPASSTTTARLHSAIGYLTPDEVFAGRMEDRLNERREKMYHAVKDRQAYWKSQPT